MAVLDLIKKVKVQKLSFEKHPCVDLDIETKVHYLNGLALVAQEDGKTCEKEKEYLSILINSFELDKETLEDYVEFAQNPDEERIIDLMDAFKSKDIKYNFMVDAMMVAQRDGKFVDAEKALIEQYFEMFKITEDEARDLTAIFEMFYKQDGNGLFRYFGKQDKYDTFLIKKGLFQYLIDYYNIDMAYELKEDEKRVLDFEFFKPTFNDDNCRLLDNAQEIMTKSVTNAQFCIYLQSAFLEKAITFDGEGKLVNSKTKDFLMDLEMSDIEFVDNEFVVCSVEDEEERITGVTYVIAELFAQWASKYNGESYKLSSYSYCNYNFDFLTYNIRDYIAKKPFNEIIFTHGSNTSLFNYKRLQIDGNNIWSRDIDNEPFFCNDECSFRLMKLPKDKE